MDINKKVAERLYELRKKSGLTSEKLAWSANLSKSCVSYAQKGTFDTKISSLYAMCKAMNITLAEFFSTFTEEFEDK